MTTETACDRLERQWHEDQWWRAYFLARRSYRLALEAQPAQCAAIISPLRRGRGDGLVDAAAAFEMVDMAAMSVAELRSLAGTLARECDLPLAAIFDRSTPDILGLENILATTEALR